MAESWLPTVVDLALAVELCCGAAANCLILRVFLRKPDLLTVANRFVVNLTVINILSCLTLLPVTIADHSITTFSLCSVAEFAAHFAASVIPYSVLLIAVDQYFAVVNPLHYHSVINGVRSYWMIAVAWIIPLLVSGFGLAESLIEGQGKGVFSSCRLLEAGSNKATSFEAKPTPYLSVAFSVTFVIVSFVIPFTLICFIYSRICSAASGNAKRTQTDLGLKSACTQATSTSDREEIEWDPEDGGLQMSATPTLTLTRASPPRVAADNTRRACKSAVDLCAKDELVVEQETIMKVNFSLPNLKTRRPSKDNPALLKPFLPRNTSFCLPSTTIPSVPPSRRHSNDVPIAHINSDILPKLSALTKHSSFTSSTRSSLWRMPVSRASSIRSTSSYLVSNLRHRLSNAGLFRYKERARAARVSALVIVMALICWSPFFGVYIIRAVVDLTGVAALEVPQLVNSLVICSLLMSTVASPALFAYRNRRIRREIRKTFKLNANEFKNCPSMGSSTNFFKYAKFRFFDVISKITGACSYSKASKNVSGPIVTPT